MIFFGGECDVGYPTLWEFGDGQGTRREGVLVARETQRAKLTGRCKITRTLAVGDLDGHMPPNLRGEARKKMRRNDCCAPR